MVHILFRAVYMYRAPTVELSKDKYSIPNIPPRPVFVYRAPTVEWNIQWTIK